jgi:hypothetical protein
MAVADTADRLARSCGPEERVLWVDRDVRRWPPRTILRLMEPETIGIDGQPKQRAPYELVVVRELVGAFSMLVDRAQFGTDPGTYPAGSFIEAVATSPQERDRPIYRGFEDL